MPRLTWQNVDNPNFSGVADSYRTFSQLLGNAMASGSAMVDTFTKAKTDAADRAIQLRAMQLQDPAAYQAALAAGTVVGPDGANASTAALTGLDSRVSKLLGNAVVGESLNKEIYDNTRQREGNQVLDANRDTVNQALSLATAGKQNEALGLLASVKGLRTDQYGNLLGDVEKSLAGSLGRDTTGQALTEKRWNFGNEMTDDASTRKARGVVAEIISKYPDAESARPALLEAAGRGDITPDVLLKTLSGASGMGYGNILAPSGSGGGAPAGKAGTPLPSGGAAWAKASGLMNNESGGNYGASNNVAGSGGTGHFGALQFSRGRLEDAKKAGVIPQDMTPEQFLKAGADVQDKVADWHFADIDSQAQSMGLDKYYGQTIKGVPITRDSIRSMAHLGGIGGVQKFITSGGKSDPADANGTKLSDYGSRYAGPETQVEGATVTGMLTQALDEGTSQRNAVGITPNYDKLLGDNSTVNDVASRLIASPNKDGEGGGVFPGSDRAEMTKAINFLINKSGNRINAAIAGEMIARSTEQNNGVLGNIWEAMKDVAGIPFGRPIRSANQPGGVRINDDAVYAALDDYTSGRTSQRDQLNEFATARSQEVEAANTMYQSALSQYKSAVLASATDPRMAQSLPRYKAQLDQAQAQRDLVRGQTNSDPSIQPKFDRTKPPEADNEGWMSGPLGLWKVRASPQ